MICKGENSAERDNVFFSMLDVLLDAYGTGEGKLYVKKTDGTLVYLNCVFNSGTDPQKEYERFKIFTIEFYAADPWFYWTKRYPFPTNQGESGHMVINNPFDSVTYVMMHLMDPIDRKHVGEPQTHGTVTNVNTRETIEFYGFSDIYKSESEKNKFYDTVDIYTDPIDKYIKGTTSTIGEPDVKENENVQEVIVGGLSAVNFSLKPGNNTIDFEFDALFTPESYIDVVKKYSGA